ncbi:MAG TPA: Ig-like domain-containing protein, partial [bacterium]|nr:Ig-like domain-containing protein [bacterium]
MKKIQNHLKTNGWKAQKSAPKGLLLFLVFLLTIQLFSCGQVVGWPDADKTAPAVKFVTPADDSTDVALNASISATFSETMDSSTFSTSSFTLFKGTTAVTGAVVYSGETAIFTPTIILDPETEYVATVTNKVKDLAGNFLAQDFEWTFTTGQTPETVPPIVIATSPSIDATEVVLNTEIIAVFSEAMNPLTITEDNFTLLDGTTPVEGVVSYNGVTATFSPENNLDQNKLYTATIHTGVTDLAGNEMEENYIWTFTTGTAIDDVRPEITSTIPNDGDIEITLDSTVSAVFSEAINPLTINDETFT